MNNNIPWDLIIPKLRQELSAEDEILFNRWLTTGNNQELFRQIETVWRNVQEKSSTYEPDSEFHWQKLSDIIRPNTIAEKKSKTIHFKYFFRVAAAASILLAASFLVNYFVSERNNVSRQATYSTQSNRSTLFLPDSSEVTLNANTTVSYHSSKKSGQRVVNLTGEAYFKVKHDAKMSFLVVTNDISIQAHGTEFNVCSYPAADKIMVSLVKGSISMHTASDKNIFLEPGEEALYDKEKKTISVAKGDMDLAEIWTKDKLRFEDKSLPEVCTYLSKWYGVDIKLSPDIIENQSYTFTVTDQSLREIIETMAKINSFDYYFTSENELVLNRKK